MAPHGPGMAPRGGVSPPATWSTAAEMHRSARTHRTARDAPAPAHRNLPPRRTERDDATLLGGVTGRSADVHGASATP